MLKNLSPNSNIPNIDSFHNNIEKAISTLKMTTLTKNNINGIYSKSTIADDEVDDVLKLLDVMSLIQFNRNDKDSIIHSPSMVSNILSDDGKIKIYLSSSNEYKIKFFKDYIALNTNAPILNHIFDFNVLQTKDDVDEVVENEYSFALNAKAKALAGMRNKIKEIDGYIIGDDTGLISTLLTSFYEPHNRYSQGFPGVISKRLSSANHLSEVLNNFGDHLSDTDKVLILHEVSYLRDNAILNEAELNCFVVIAIIDCIYKVVADRSNGKSSLYNDSIMYSEKVRCNYTNITKDALWSKWGIIATTLCAVNTVNKQTVTSTGSIRGTLTGNFNFHKLVNTPKNDTTKYDCLNYLKGTIGYNNIVFEVSKHKIEKLVNPYNHSEFYANNLNNPKAMTKLLIDVLVSFYSQAYNIDL